ncbi:MAG: hypothetical protein ACREFE_17145 [Limisphaerales bacterium]
MATTNFVLSQNYATGSLTNGLATTNYVNAATNGVWSMTINYINSLEASFLSYLSVLASTNYVNAAIISDTNFPVGLNADNINVTNTLSAGTVIVEGSHGLTAWAGTSSDANVNSGKTEYAPPNNSATMKNAYASGGTCVPATRSVTLANLYVIISTATGGSNGSYTSTLTVLTNGVASSLAVSISGTGTTRTARTFSDTTDSVTIPAGTEIGIEIQTGSSAANSKYSWSFEGL